MTHVPVKTIGISTELPTNPQYFTQFSIPEILIIPEPKPDMEQLVSVAVDVDIVSIRLVNTPCIKSYEGQLLSGKKLILELRLIEKVTYVADEPTQSVHAAHFEKTMKSVFVVVPQEINGLPIEEFFKNNQIEITPYIEDIYAQQRDERTI